MDRNTLKIIFREIFSTNHLERQTEPSLVMEDEQNAIDFFNYGDLTTPLGMSYLFYAAHICDVIKKDDVVLDLGCGSGKLLCLVATLNPQAKFIGLELSDSMIAIAENARDKMNLSNVEFLKQDMTDLSRFQNQSIDAITSTVALHHLPSVSSLNTVCKEIHRVLKPQGGLFLSDYGRLKSEASLRFFSNKYQDRQTELLTLDYYNSLRASFSKTELKTVYKEHLSELADFYSTLFVPLFITIKSKKRRDPTDHEFRKYLDARISELSPDLQKDFKDLILFCRLGGL